MSAESDALQAFLNNTGIPHKVTSITSGVHAPTSYHYRGLAVDFAGPVPTSDSAVLLSIWKAFTRIETQLAELIYAGGVYQIKHGKRVPASFYGATTMAAHHNHVHVAVESGFRFKGVVNVPDGTRPRVNAPVTGISYTPTGNGYVLVCADGGVFAFGDAKFFGNVEYVLPAGDDWSPAN